jgi:hypothetical protein
MGRREGNVRDGQGPGGDREMVFTGSSDEDEKFTRRLQNRALSVWRHSGRKDDLRQVQLGYRCDDLSSAWARLPFVAVGISRDRRMIK